ncbi:MAG: hypothetical protein WBQ11_19960 [Isosphaeraceae bacterium]
MRQRNRTISGLCLGIVVVEAAPRTGVAIHRAPRHGALFYRRKLTPALLTAGHSPLAPRPTIVRVRRLCRALSRSQHSPPDTV